MKKVTITCDLCGTEEGVKRMELPVFRTFDETDGRTFFDEPHIYIVPIDICPCCLRKVTNIHDFRVQGFGYLAFEDNPVLKKED